MPSSYAHTRIYNYTFTGSFTSVMLFVLTPKAHMIARAFNSVSYPCSDSSSVSLTTLRLLIRLDALFRTKPFTKHCMCLATTMCFNAFRHDDLRA